MSRKTVRWIVCVGLVVSLLLAGGVLVAAETVAEGSIKGVACDGSSHVLLQYATSAPSELWYLRVMIGISHNEGPCPVTLAVYRYAGTNDDGEVQWERIVLAEGVEPGQSRFVMFKLQRQDQIRYECSTPEGDTSCCCSFTWAVYSLWYQGG